jgi:APA family basic amino acid/polyamine antiporter
MLGAGLVAGLAPAVSAAGTWVLASIVVAALAAAALSTVDSLAPASPPGAPLAARVAVGLGLLGRVAAAMAIAAAFGDYVLPDRPAVAAVALAMAATAATVLGARLPAPNLRIAVGMAVGIVLAVLAVFVTVCFAIEPAEPVVAVPPGSTGSADPWGLPAAAGLMFFAFLGFHRAAEPGARRSRRAALLAIGIASAVYLGVAAAALHQLGGPRLALSPAPLRDAMAAADAAALDSLLTVGVAVAAACAALAVLGDVRRIGAVYCRSGELPTWLAGLAAATGAVLLAPPTTIALAAGAMLAYYVLVNLAAAGCLRWTSDP